MKVLLGLVLSALAALATAQETLWKNVCEVRDNSVDRPVDLVSCPDGSVVFGGTNGDAVVVKAGPDGSERWRFSEGSVTNEPDVIQSLVLTGSGDVAALMSQGDSISYLVGLDGATGAEKWRTPLQGYGWDYGYPTLLLRKDGRLLLVADKGGIHEGPVLVTVDPATGAILREKRCPVSFNHPQMLPGGDLLGYAIVPSAGYQQKLVRLDTATVSVLWMSDETGQISTDRDGRIYLSRATYADNTQYVEIVRLDAQTGSPTWHYLGPNYSSYPIVATSDAEGNPVFAYNHAEYLHALARVVKLDRRTGRLIWEQNLDGLISYGGTLYDVGLKTLSYQPNGTVVLSVDVIVSYYTVNKMGVFALDAATGAVRSGHVDTDALAQIEEPRLCFAAPDGTVRLAGRMSRPNADTFATWAYDPLTTTRLGAFYLPSREAAETQLVGSYQANGVVNVATTPNAWVFEKVADDGTQSWRTVLRRRDDCDLGGRWMHLDTGLYHDPASGMSEILGVGILNTRIDAVCVDADTGKVKWLRSLVGKSDLQSSVSGTVTTDGSLFAFGNLSGFNAYGVARIDRTTGRILWTKQIVDDDWYRTRLFALPDGNLLVYTPRSMAKVSAADGTMIWSREQDRTSEVDPYRFAIDADGIFCTTEVLGTGAYVSMIQRISIADGSVVWFKEYPKDDLAWCTVVSARGGSIAVLASLPDQNWAAVRLSKADGTEQGRVLVPSAYDDTLVVEDLALDDADGGYLAGERVGNAGQAAESAATLYRLDFATSRVRWFREHKGVDHTVNHALRVRFDPSGNPIAVGAFGRLGGDGRNTVLTTVCYSKG